MADRELTDALVAIIAHELWEVPCVALPNSDEEAALLGESARDIAERVAAAFQPQPFPVALGHTTEADMDGVRVETLWRFVGEGGNRDDSPD